MDHFPTFSCSNPMEVDMLFVSVILWKVSIWDDFGLPKEGSSGVGRHWSPPQASRAAGDSATTYMHKQLAGILLFRSRCPVRE